MKKFMCRTLGLVLVLAMILTLAACGGQNNPGSGAAPNTTPGSVTPDVSAESDFSYPDRKIEIVVGFGTGSGTDITARAIAEPLQEILGVPVVVTNIEGSQGIKGMEYTERQPADGYTLFLTTQTQLLAQINDLSDVKITEDFEPLARLVHSVVLITGNGNGRFKDINELIAYAKEHPGDVKLGGIGMTSVDAVAVREFCNESGAGIEYVSFGSGSELSSALMGGHIDLACSELADSIPLMESGDLIGMVVLADERLPSVPDIPCSVELGINATMGAWRGLSVKAGTDSKIIDFLNEKIVEAMKTKSWANFVQSNGLDQRPGYANNTDFAALWESEYTALEAGNDENLTK